MQVDEKPLESSDKDINEIFEDILLGEEQIIDKSYKEGYTIGKNQKNPEAYHLGYHRGAELGAELGYYCGFIQHIKNRGNSENSNRNAKLINDISHLIENFPNFNCEDIDIIESLIKVRAKFKKLCAILKIDAAFPETNKFTF